ncbi:unnamed protein product [Meloidogyne enterolobii]|uniref:Uncharacterized protein n=1 Tax=Meloidogyne enterolobii TaxID=390850 RepID=A0ACB0ZBK8_MELEN
MLGRLVNKFKRQTLQDGASGDASPPAQLSPPPLRDTETGCPTTRRSARLNEKADKESVEFTTNSSVSLALSQSPPTTRARRAQLEAAAAVSEQKQQFISITSRPTFGGNYQFGCASSDNNLRHLANPTTNILATRPPHRPLAHCDSGTESSDDDEDDEELEMLDSLSNASRAALEEGIGRSPPTLTSSPPLISEIETSSWDSCGCESGIVLRDSAERDDASRNVDLLEAALGGGELVLDIDGKKQMGTTFSDETAGTTPVQSKDAFPAHFHSSSITKTSSSGTLPLPIDFSSLRQSELFGSANVLDDTPTPIGSHKTTGQGAALMEMAVAENRAKAEENTQNEPGAHQGAFRRVLRRNRRNSNSQTSISTSIAAARTVSPLGVGLGEKRRWGDPALTTEIITTTTTTCVTPQEILIHPQQQPERSETPIAARTRAASMLMATAMLGSGPNNIDSSNDRQVLTAARRTRVRILYSASQHQQQQKGGLAPPFQQMPQTIQGRRGQVAPMLGQSPPYMLANKRGRHCSKSGMSPPRPSLNFDKMRKRMLNNVSNNCNDLENLTLNEKIREKNGTD